MPDDSVHYELSIGPDAQNPDRLFKDGAGAACVRAMPVWATTWGTRSPAFAFEDAVVMIAVGWMRRHLWRWVRRDDDDRWKLVVSCTKRRFPPWWRTVAVEFFETEQAAEQRQLQILKEWDNGQYASRPALGPRERQRLRLR